MMILKSIKWRLQLWYGLILLLVLVGFGVTAYRLENGRQYRQVDDELHRRSNVLMNALQFPRRGPGPGGGLGFDLPDGPPDQEPGPPEERNGRFRRDAQDRFPEMGDGFHLPPRAAALFDENSTNGFYYVIWNPEGTELTRSTNTPPGEIPIPRREFNGENLPATQRDERPPLRDNPLRPPAPRMRGSLRELSLFGRGQIVLVGRSIAPELAEMRQTAWILSGVGGIILLLGLAGGWCLASRAIKPVEEISSTASKIAAGDLSQRINVAETESELGQLASVLNATFSRLDAAFAQQQQFTSDAAHELRTPVSVMLTQTQTALKSERKAEEYRATVEACQRSAQRMRGLIESLLKLARLDAGQETMRRAPFDLARMVGESVEHIRPLAANRGITIEENLEAAECVADVERLGQVVTNLLTNAVNYNRENGTIRVTTRREGSLIAIEISDTGIGIPPEHLPNVFKRFYRVDTARTTSQGRSGLGLAISKAIVEAHGGSIEVASEVNQGTTFTVRLPAS
jgi:two-component system, OmpR family, sensor kinase